MLTQNASFPDNPLDGSALLCDVWDNSTLQLKAGDYPGTGSGSSIFEQAKPSNGAAVWNSGFVYAAKPSDLKYTVRYAHLDNPGNATSDCRTGIFYDSPDAVPGNDKQLVQQGIYSAVNAVRIWTTLPKASLAYSAPVRTFYSIALSVVPGQKNGAIMPNWASTQSQFNGFLTEDQLLKLPPARKSTYNPETNGGLPGDRLLYAPAYVRLDKTVVDVQKKLTNATAGDKVVWTLTPKLSSSAVSSFIQAQPVTIEDCLPAGLVFDSATVNPMLNQPVTVSQPVPDDAEIQCGAGSTYLRFDLGNHVPNRSIDPIVVTTRISELASVGTFANNATIQTDPADPSPLAARSSSAQVSIQQVAGVKLEKTALTPQIQVNSPNATTFEKNVWKLVLANLNSPQAVSNADVIDVLPVATGVNGSKFSGSMQFDSAAVTRGSNVTILYTSSPTVTSNPRDKSNSATGIAWCNKPSGGNRVTGTGDCPASASDVTGIRFQKPGTFASGDTIEATVTMIAKGNKPADIYVNRAQAAVDGLTFTVGPTDVPETVVASSIGDTVWLDFNGNGIQDDGKAGVSNFPVSLKGTDDLGNDVSLMTTTNADGIYHFTGLREGSYTVTFDKDGLRGAQQFTTQSVGNDRTIDSDGNATTGVTVAITLGKNQARTDIDQGIVAPGVVWTKTDGTTLLKDSEWELAGPEGFTTLTITDCVTDSATQCEGPDLDPKAGQFALVNLPQGDYTLTETKAPSGYFLDATPHLFTVDVDAYANADWQQINVGSVTNSPRPAIELPLTGGIGTYLFYIGGCGALVVAGSIVIISGQRSKKTRTQ